MRVLVTGGCGFIGSHICDLLVEEGHEVLVADNLSTGNRHNLNPKAKLYEVDILKPEFEQVFQENKVDVIYHEAAQIDVQKSLKEPDFDATVNIIGSIQVLKMAAKYQVKKLIYASSAAVYGDPLYLPVDEDHPIAPLSYYGISKHTPEHYIAAFSELYGFDYTILRYANVYGLRQDPKGEGGVVSIFTDRLIRGEAPVIFGDGEQTRDFVFVRDVARANLLALTKGSKKIINVSTNQKLSVNELFAKMKKAAQSDVEPEYQPARPGDILHSYLNNALAKEELGFVPAYTLEEGLQETIDYYREKMQKSYPGCKKIVAEDYEDLSRIAGKYVRECIEEKPDLVLGLPTGSTPIGMYDALVKMYETGQLDFSQVTTFNLDEYLGLQRDHNQSYYYFMNQHLYSKVNLKPENINIPNGVAQDMEAECAAYDEKIIAKGGLDVMVLGVGQNGHIGFNEPGDELEARTHIVSLTENTIKANARFFDSEKDVPTKAITMGMGQILKAKKILLLVSGKEKRRVIQEMFSDHKIDTENPVTFLLLHPDVTLVIDRDALGDEEL